MKKSYIFLIRKLSLLRETKDCYEVKDNGSSQHTTVDQDSIHQYCNDAELALLSVSSIHFILVLSSK